MKTKPITTRINEQLRKAGRTERFVRGQGYYYVRGVAVSSAMYQFWLDNASADDYRHAVEHVNAVLLEESKLHDGKPAITLI